MLAINWIKSVFTASIPAISLFGTWTIFCFLFGFTNLIQQPLHDRRCLLAFVPQPFEVLEVRFPLCRRGRLLLFFTGCTGAGAGVCADVSLAGCALVAGCCICLNTAFISNESGGSAFYVHRQSFLSSSWYYVLCALHVNYYRFG